MASGFGVCEFFMTSEGGSTIGSQQREPKADGKMSSAFFYRWLGAIAILQKQDAEPGIFSFCSHCRYCGGMTVKKKTLLPINSTEGEVYSSVNPHLTLPALLCVATV